VPLTAMTSDKKSDITPSRGPTERVRERAGLAGAGWLRAAGPASAARPQEEHGPFHGGEA